MSARDNILQRLRAAPPSRPIATPDVHGFYAAARAALPIVDRAARIERFCEKMAFWRGEVIKVTHNNWTEILREQCIAKGITSLLYGGQSVHGATLAASALPGLKTYDRPIEQWKAALFENTDAGFTLSLIHI